MSNIGGTSPHEHDTRYVAPGWMWLVVASSTAVLLVSVLSGWVMGLPAVVYALAVPVGIFFGMAGAVGFALGRLFFGLWSNSVSIVSIVQFGGDFCLVAVGYLLWNGSPVPAVGDGWRVVLSRVVRYLLTATTAVICNVAIVSLGSTSLGRIPIGASVPVLFIDRGGFVIVLGALGLVLMGFIDAGTPQTAQRMPTLTNRSRFAVVLVAFAWLGGTFVLGLVRQDITSVPGAREEFFDYAPPVAVPVAEFVLGPGYYGIQVLGAVLASSVAIGLIAYARRQERHRRK
jgi:hypothetical protein